jgi:hypothetical protein
MKPNYRELVGHITAGLLIGLGSLLLASLIECLTYKQQNKIIVQQRVTIESCIQDLKYAEEGLQDATRGICIAGEISEVWANLANQCCREK